MEKKAEGGLTMILIPIDMPTNCIECPCHNDDGCYCQLLINDKADWEMDIDFFNNRRENCPLIAVNSRRADNERARQSKIGAL